MVLWLLVVMEGRMKRKQMVSMASQIVADITVDDDGAEAAAAEQASPSSAPQNSGQSLGSSLVHVYGLLKDPEILRSMLGAAGSWFLFDVTFYGNTLFEDEVLGTIFGGDESPTQLTTEEILVYAIALPGYYLALLFMHRLGPKVIQLQGFIMMGIIYLLIGIFWTQMLEGSAAILLVMYALTFVFSNFGPNSTTFILPSLTFPAHARSSLNGICAACGKLGAIVGSSSFSTLDADWGVQHVLMLCGGIAFLGALLTVFFVKSAKELEQKGEEERTRSHDALSIAQSPANSTPYEPF